MNHLLIGLGGTGGSILRAFRKQMYQSYRDAEPDGVFIDYLLVDSDPKAFNDEDDRWSVLGRSLVLPNRNRCKIMQANLPGIVDNLQAYPQLRDWLGNRDAWGEILKGLNIDSAGGQKRRLGRFLFAMHGQSFCDQVSDLVGDLRGRSNKSPVTFHIFCGLAGGTGSGTIIDTIVQLRRMYADANQMRIMVYAYLPDLHPPAAWAKTNYHANAYAALLELNALGASAFAPYDVVSGSGRLERDFWFNGCYVYSDTNDQGHRAAVDGELLETVADFVFHKTVVARHVQWDALQRWENSENGDSAPEASPAKKPLRSVRFLSFGIKRLAFAEETIREYLTYDFAAQAYRQLQFNNWFEGMGYLETPRVEGLAAYVADPKQREDWRVADEFLMLDRSIIDPPGPPMPRYADEWQSWENQYVALSLQGKDKLKWLSELQDMFLTAWRSNFRRAGVEPFFATMKGDETKMAMAVRERVEATLFDEWTNGQRSLNSCALTVAALIDELSKRLSQIDDKRQAQQQTIEANDRLLQAMEKEWTSLRILGAVTSSRERELRKAGGLLRAKYLARTNGEALLFSKSLTAKIITQLTELKTSLDSNEALLGKAAKDAVTAVQARSLPTEAETDSQTMVKRLDDAPGVKAARDILVLNEEEQRTATSAVRSKIVGALGPNRRFGALAEKLTAAELRNIIIQTCEANVISAHQRLIAQNRASRVIGVSIIDKLQERWGGNPELMRREARELTRSAGRFVVFDNSQTGLAFPGMSKDPRGVETFAVIMPKPAEHREFVEAVGDAFKQARQGGAEILPSNERSNEITLISLVNLFPLRFVDLVGALREKYEQRLKQDRARGTLEIHIEGDGTQFPSLFVADASEIGADARRLLLLAEGMGIILSNRSAETGRTSLILKAPDANMLDEPLVLGSDLIEIASNARAELIGELQIQVSKSLARYRHVDAQAGVREAIIARLQKIAEARGGDPTDSVVAQWRDAAKTAIKNLEEGTAA